MFFLSYEERGGEMTWKAAEVGMSAFLEWRWRPREREAAWQLHWMKVRAVRGMEQNESFCHTVVTVLF